MKSTTLFPLLFALSYAPLIAEADSYCNSGPWGKIKYANIFLEAPESVVRLIPAPSRQTVWRFPEMNIEEVAALRDSFDTDPEWKSLMRAETPLQSVDDETRAFPSFRVIRSFTPEARLKLYRFLSRFEENPFHYHPVIIDTEALQDWFPRDRMPDEALALIKELSIPLENALAFADVPSLLPLAKTEKEEVAMRKALTRSRSMLLSLEFSPDSDFQELIEYWTIDGTSKGALPFFESLQRVDDDITVGIADILPLTPRRYLNTFPGSAEGITGSFPNKYWTTFNFFRITPDPKFLRETVSMDYLAKHYMEIERPLKYGDIVAFTDPDRGQILHVCNFIADDIVYTKNGKSLLNPWVFMRIEELKSRFSIRKTANVQYWRKKPVEPASLNHSVN